ncbi:MAG: type II toxin-antitoxin system CcdA family antitoxin [Acidimicrobiia bacterium]
MARINVYLPDDLAEEAKVAGLNVSALTQQALRRTLTATELNEWLDEVIALTPLGVGRTALNEAIAAAKDELEGDG